MSAALTPGTPVRHPAYGSGAVSTVACDWRGNVTGAEVEFEVRGIVRKLVCKACDLTVVDAPRPPLRVVEPVVA